MALSQGIPEYQHRLFGTYYGNVLDSYDSVTYNIRIFMKDQSGNNSITIAQTGVTANQVDNLEIEIADSTNTVDLTVNFDIIQPGRANLLDQIVLAKSHLGLKSNVMPPLFLAVTFLGRFSDLDENDEQGGVAQAEDIVDVFERELVVVDVKSSLTESGATFNFQTKVNSLVAKSEQHYRLPETVKAVGKDLISMIKHLENQLNRFSAATKKQIKDVYKIDTRFLIQEGADPEAEFTDGAEVQDLIQYPKLLTHMDFGSSQNNIGLLDDHAEVALAEFSDSFYNQVYRDPVTEGDSEIKEINELVLHQGETLHSAITTMLCMNKNFMAMISRKTSLDPEVEVKTADQVKPYTRWVTMNFQSMYLGHDPVTNTESRIHIYYPTIVKLTGERAQAAHEENNDIPENVARQRTDMLLGDLDIKKVYQYLFTGLNDQIESLDITMDLSHSVLMSHQKGTTGDIYVDAREGVIADSVEDSEKDLREQEPVGERKEQIEESPENVNVIERTLPPSYTADGTQIQGYSEDFVVLNRGVDVDQIEKANINFDNSDVMWEYRLASQTLERNMDSPTSGATTLTGAPTSSIFGQVATQLEDTNLFLQLNMTLRGDPWYLTKDFGGSHDPTDESHVNMYFGDHHIALEVEAPIPYDLDTDDEDNNTGYWNKGMVNYAYSGIFNVLGSTHRFSGGKYTTEIRANKVNSTDIARRLGRST